MKKIFLLIAIAGSICCSAQIYPAGAGIENIPAKNLGINIYPNPGSGFFNMVLKSDKDIKATINVYDILGKAVYSKTFYHVEGINVYDLDLKNFVPGIYSLELFSEELISSNISRTVKKLNVIY